MAADTACYIKTLGPIMQAAAYRRMKPSSKCQASPDTLPSLHNGGAGLSGRRSPQNSHSIVVESDKSRLYLSFQKATSSTPGGDMATLPAANLNPLGREILQSHPISPAKDMLPHLRVPATRGKRPAAPGERCRFGSPRSGSSRNVSLTEKAGAEQLRYGQHRRLIDYREVVWEAANNAVLHS